MINIAPLAGARISKVPTYEFTCPNGHDFDKFFRSMASAPSVVPCPVCGKPAERQMSAGAGLVFHGSGFYITDYGKDGKKDQKMAGRRTSESKKDSAASGSSGGAEGSGSTDSAAGGSSSASTSASSTSDSASAKPADAPAKPAATSKGTE